MVKASRTLAIFVGLVAVGCSAPLTRGERLDPNSCAGCHPDAYREWSGSMHAYASADPVFRAMNARGQRETNGQLGDFCVRCHAPLALAEGVTTDGTNLDTVAAPLQGVTCAFCHQLDAVTGTHNAMVHWADDGVMRAGIADPFENHAHDSAYSTLHDRDALDSSKMCGACHDVVLPGGHALERTFAEWNGTLFSNPSSVERLSCQGCHMPGRPGRAAEVDGAPDRRIKSHLFAAVDVAVTPFPERDAQRAQVDRELSTALQASLCVIPQPTGGASISVSLDNVAAGHDFPSGAAHDRRVWLELVAERGGVVQLATGTVADGQPVSALDDPRLMLFRDRARRADGSDALMFWEVDHSEPNVLRGPVTRDPTDPRYFDTHRRAQYFVPNTPDVVRMRMRMRPIGVEILQSLVDTGDLAADLLPRFATYDLGATVIEWRASDGQLCIPKGR